MGLAPDFGDHRLSLASQSGAESETLARLIAPLAGAEAQRLAKRLLKNFGSLKSLLRADPNRVSAVSGNRNDIACKISLLGDLVDQALFANVHERQIFQTPMQVLDHVAGDMMALRVETLRVLFLDSANRLISDEILAEGTVDSLIFYPREIIRRALACDATGLVMVHNHPTGLPQPSAEDVSTTKKLASLAGQLGIALHDHLVIASSGWCSLKSEGHV